MTISDIDDPTGCSFFIAHPTKSFVIVAESREVKTLWLRDTFQTIVSCRKREALRANGLRKMSIIDRIEGQQKSGLSQAPRERDRERERDGAQYQQKIHHNPLPCLSIPPPPSFSSFSPASSKILQATESSTNLLYPSLGSTSSDGSAFSMPRSSPSIRQLQRMESLKEERRGNSSPSIAKTDSDETNNPSDVFSTIMQMATLHMDEVELLTVAGGISPESSSGVNTPEKRRNSSAENLRTLPGLASALQLLDSQLEGQKEKEKEKVLSLQKIEPPASSEEKAEADRSAVRKDAVRTFEKRISELPEKSLRGLFNAVSTYCTCASTMTSIFPAILLLVSRHHTLHFDDSCCITIIILSTYRELLFGGPWERVEEEEGAWMTLS